MNGNVALVITAAIAAVPPTLAVWLSYRKIHAVVNSRLDHALATIKSLEAEIRQLRSIDERTP